MAVDIWENKKLWKHEAKVDVFTADLSSPKP